MVQASVRPLRLGRRSPGRPVSLSVVTQRVGVSRRPSLMGSTAFVLILAITALLSWTAYSQNVATEKRLLRLQTRQTASVVQAFVAGLRTPLASAAQIAASTGGATHSYRSYASSFLRRQARFVSVSLWRVHGTGAPSLLNTTGTEPLLADVARRRDAFLTGVSRSTSVGVTGFLNEPERRIGYGFASATSGVRYVVYAEDVLRAPYRQATSGPFADLRYALYLGRTQSPRTLLATDERRLPLHGRTARSVIPFGNSSLILVAAPVGDLAGKYSGDRWWFVGVVGLLVALGAGLAMDRLVRRGRSAEALAGENEVLLAHQRSIAETLQRALMPAGIPDVVGLQLAARYIPGVHGIEIGGDWYDVIPIDETHVAFVVGDVSGRGLEAGSIMASLHFAIRGFVSEGHDPATVLTLLTQLLVLRRDGHFATVVCGVVDVERQEVTLANAGHLPPLVVANGTGEFLATEVGPPIGVRTSYPYRSVTIALPPDGTLLAFTDGLVERRGETIDDGLHRLRQSAQGNRCGLDELVSTIVDELTPRDASDDTALLGLRWRSGAPA